jgi:hypothetical protein
MGHIFVFDIVRIDAIIAASTLRWSAPMNLTQSPYAATITLPLKTWQRAGFFTHTGGSPDRALSMSLFRADLAPALGRLLTAVEDEDWELVLASADPTAIEAVTGEARTRRTHLTAV